MIDKTSDVNAAYDNFETMFLEVIDNHTPMKKKKAINKPAPFMNQTLRREIYKEKWHITNNKNV